MLTKTTLFTILCASTLAMAPLLSGCFGGCAVYDGEGNHMEDGGSAGEGGSSGSGGSGGSGGSAGSGSADAGPDCSCVQAYGSAAMDTDSIKLLVNEGLPSCFSKEPGELEKQAACLPAVVGQDAANGMDLQVYYFCSDVCPDYGGVSVGYAGVENKEDCCALGGEPVIDPAWGGFAGCAPTGLGMGDAKACVH